jgi:radical S-adenosyl methionine domain-containing protein 2
MTTPTATTLPPSVNYHLWQPCNMRCHHCFATFEDVKASVLPRGHLPEEQAIAVVALLGERFEKITFAGGEPTLCPWLFELVRRAHEAGSVTMLVTNGSILDEAWLDRFAGVLDWITLSIDSVVPETNRKMGRAVSGRPLSAKHYAKVASDARARGMRLKVNTVVTALNVTEDMHAILETLAPERWKVLQALPVAGQNDADFARIACADEDFRRFVERHSGLGERGIAVVPEDNHAMRGSYAMVDPAGRFFDNIDGAHRYSRPILDVGVEAGWTDIRFSMALFDQRGGRYEIGSPGGRRLPLAGE